ncbi:hypothetical protein O181_079367 [Austropuccinia psidii MF-1]|uniref:Ecp2 effector protein domain-containing protein n=1 Tax=Austropuccinia psidii MF-1 TaxID=1389203 RepID=A0A9Q3IGG1_9BASI|nr:hypothetical protein [Austropuccinia psidii MF-1]
MIFKVIHLVSLAWILAGFISSIQIEATHTLRRRGDSKDLVIACEKSFSMDVCRRGFDLAWANNQIHEFTTNHQFTIRSGCKFTWWTDNEKGVVITSLTDLTDVLARIGDFCSTTSQVGGPKRALWAGSLGESHVALQVDLVV